VVTGDTGAHNVGPFSSNLDQLLAGKFSPTASPTNPVQDSAENGGDIEDCSDENQLIEVQLFHFKKGKTAYSSSSSHSVRGRLKAHISFWRRLQPSDFILSSIHDGYKIPFFVYAIAAVPDWDTEFDLDEFCLVEVNFWQENLTALNTRQFIKPVFFSQQNCIFRRQKLCLWSAYPR